MFDNLYMVQSLAKKKKKDKIRQATGRETRSQKIFNTCKHKGAKKAPNLLRNKKKKSRTPKGSEALWENTTTSERPSYF